MNNITIKNIIKIYIFYRCPSPEKYHNLPDSVPLYLFPPL